MKRQLFFAALLLIGSCSFAQKQKAMKLYYGAQGTITTLHKDVFWGGGFSAGVYLSPNLSIGAGINHIVFDKCINNQRQDYQYSILNLETNYILTPQNRIRFLGYLSTGAGFLQNKPLRLKEVLDIERIGKWHYVLTPGAGMQWGVTSRLSLTAKAGYRFSGDPGTNTIAKNGLNGFTGNLSLTISKF